MALCVASKVIRLYLCNASGVNVARRYVPCGYQVAQPLGGVRVDFVVIGGHGGVQKRDG
jgi:hypothetical protein